MTRRILIAVAVAATLCGCESRPRAESAAVSDTDRCSVAVADSVTLSAADQCVFDAYRRACRRHEGEKKESDLCVLRCMAKGEPGVAGGCWHICRTLPAGVKACDALRPKRDP